MQNILLHLKYFKEITIFPPPPPLPQKKPTKNLNTEDNPQKSLVYKCKCKDWEIRILDSLNTNSVLTKKPNSPFFVLNPKAFLFSFPLQSLQYLKSGKENTSCCWHVL